MRDNRKYTWERDEVSERQEYEYIEEWIEPCSSIIDLGCGDGSLLKRLKDRKQVEEQGIEISQSGVDICREKGLCVTRGSIDTKLEEIADHTFDYSVCNVTLQMVMHPETVLGEMCRISRKQIVSFPNFAYYMNRLEMLTKGRMPRRLLFGYQWYSTGHIHQLSIADFKETIGELGMKVLAAKYFGKNETLARAAPNLFAYEAMFLMERS